MNVHLGCEYCNTFLHGNLIPYRKNLIKKIGRKEFKALESRAHKTRKYTREELKEIMDRSIKNYIKISFKGKVYISSYKINNKYNYGRQEKVVRTASRVPRHYQS